MKRYILHLMTAMLAGASLIATSCSDSDTEGPKAPEPNFPSAVTATLSAGETYTINIEPNQNWEVSIPSTVGGWYWIQDGSQKVYTLRGEAGKAQIVIGVSEQEEYDENRVCEVTMTMAGQKQVIATITRGTIERKLTVYACQIDEEGNFVYEPEGTGYIYEETPATNIGLIWPISTNDYSRPILVEANFDWAIGDMPAWLETPKISTGAAGTKVALRCIGDITRLPLDGGEGELVFIDQKNHDAKFTTKISVPACKDLFRVELVENLRFDEQGQYYNEMTTSWLPGSIFGSYLSTKGTKIYYFSEVYQLSGNYLSAEPEDTDWLIPTEDAWNETQEGGVVQSIKFTVGAKANTGDAHKGYVVVLPPAVAATITDPYQIVDAEIRPEFQQYLFGTITQKPALGTVQPLTPDDMNSIGASYEKLRSNDMLLQQFGVSEGHEIIYTKKRSSGTESMFKFTRPFTGYKFFDKNFAPVDAAQSFMTVDEVPGQGYIIRMSKEDEGYIVFYDDKEEFALIHCIYDPSIVIELPKIEFVYPDVVENAELQEITSGPYYDKYVSTEAQIYQLTYKGNAYTPNILVPHFKTAKAEDGVKWLKWEGGGTEGVIVHMNAETSSEGVLIFYTADNYPVLVLVCKLVI